MATRGIARRVVRTSAPATGHGPADAPCATKAARGTARCRGATASGGTGRRRCASSTASVPAVPSASSLSTDRHVATGRVLTMEKKHVRFVDRTRTCRDEEGRERGTDA